jgi:hypothetical protein
MEELSNVQGRAWEDVDVSADGFPGCRLVLTFNSIDRTMSEGMRKEAIGANVHLSAAAKRKIWAAV